MLGGTMPITTPPHVPVDRHAAREARLAEAKRRARYVSSYARTPFEQELGNDVLFLLREIKRLEEMIQAESLPFDAFGEGA
jgi:hypothetical protein